MGDKFSFPVTSQNSDDFEFGSTTSPSSPADHLFSNGKLLPHTYTVQASNNFSYSRSTSRASSRERRPPARRNEKIARPPVMSCRYHEYGSSRQWQLIAAAPVLKRQASSSRPKKIDTCLDRKASKGGDEGSKAWHGRAFLKSFLSACNECHAI